MSNGYMRQVYICKDSNFSHKYTFCPVILYFIFEFYVLTVTNIIVTGQTFVTVNT